MKIITVTNIASGRSYKVETNDYMTLDIIWSTQKCWFMQGDKVNLSDNFGNLKTFIA